MQLLCLSLVVMRCQPLRRALGFFLENGGNFDKGIYYG
ncbi:hypothetical protein VCHE16_3600 [Vibrio paracholerae HE-16]|nr:hypothetical protein VCHE16_3600 [Vibrio paracholerae HE-16]